MSLELEVAQLTDEEAQRALNALLKRLAIDNPDYGRFVASEDEMRSVLTTVAVALNEPARNIAEPEANLRPELVRQILASAAKDAKLRGYLENYLKNPRGTLLEPVTTALVLAGIVMVLSTKFHFEAEKKDGKTNWKFMIGKKATPDPILKKFFAIFS